MQDNNALIWMDLEMTGLDPSVNRIIEIATIVTDKDLNIVAEGPVFAIHQSDEHLSIMDEWNQKHHGESGLIERVRESTINEDKAATETIEFLRQYVPKGRSPLCGNSICQDRRFLYQYMPTLCDYMHYRHIDVSTIKELANRWSPMRIKDFTKVSSHTALSDIRESIEELKFYRQQLFIE